MTTEGQANPKESRERRAELWESARGTGRAEVPKDGGKVRWWRTTPVATKDDTTATEEPTPAGVQPPRQAKTKDAEFHYTK